MSHGSVPDIKNEVFATVEVELNVMFGVLLNRYTGDTYVEHAQLVSEIETTITDRFKQLKEMA